MDAVAEEMEEESTASSRMMERRPKQCIPVAMLPMATMTAARASDPYSSASAVPLDAQAPSVSTHSFVPPPPPPPPLPPRPSRR